MEIKFLEKPLIYMYIVHENITKSCNAGSWMCMHFMSMMTFT